MRGRSRGAALAALFIVVFLPFPLINGLHLVSSQHTGTDNQNNPPVHYVPKMASKLGLPQPQNREPEYLTDETLATAVRQLLESHKRQTAFLERLAALAPRSKADEVSQKKTRNPTTRTSQFASKNSEPSVIMRPPKQKPAENVKPQEPIETSQTGTLYNKTVEKVSVHNNPTPAQNHVQYPPKQLYHRFVSPAQNLVYVPSNFPLPVGPYPQFSQSFYPHFIGETQQNQLPQVHPGLHPNFAGKEPSIQDANIHQRPYLNVAGSSQGPPFSQGSQSSFVNKAPTSINSNIPQGIRPNVFSEAYHSQNADTPHGSQPNFAGKVFPTNYNIPQGPHTNVFAEASHDQNGHTTQGAESNFVSKTPSTLNYKVPQGPHPNVFGEPSHSPTAHTPQGTQPSVAGKIPPTPNYNIPQGLHPNVFGEASHNQNAHIPQGNQPHFVGKAPPSLNSQLYQGPHPSVFGEAFHSQNAHIPQETRPHFVVKPPHSHTPNIPQGPNPNFVQNPQGYLPHVGSGEAHLQNPRFLPQEYPPHNGQYPYNPYFTDTQPVNVISPVLNDYRRHFLVNPQLSNVNIQHPSLHQNRSQ